MRRIILILSLVLLICVGCSKEDNQLPKMEYEAFSSLLYSKSVTLGEIIEVAKEEYQISDETLAPYEAQLDKLSLIARYDVHAIEYNTTAPNGEPIVASGLIYYPKFIIPKGVIEVSPVNKSKGTCATEHYKAAELIPCMTGYIAITPDLIGCGSTAKLPISYLQHENVAVVSADMRRAAKEFLFNHYQYKISNKSILFGYSLGGSGAWSLARYYHQNPSLGVQPTEIFIGGGAYVPRTVIEAQLTTRRSDYAITPNILWSMNHYDDLNIDFDEIFIRELKENYNEWCRGYMPIAELTQRLGRDIGGYISESFLADIESQTELMEALDDKAIPQDWLPECRVHLFHSKEDYYVPTILSDNLYEYLSANGVDVEYTKYDEPHVEAGAVMLVDFMKFLNEQSE